MSTAELVDENKAGREVTTQLENMPVPYSVSDSKIAEIWLDGVSGAYKLDRVTSA